jgi:hypothetical protein
MAFGQFGSAMFINPAKKRSKRKGTKKSHARRKPRSAKQKAATRKLVARNKAKARGGSKMAKKSKKRASKPKHKARKRRSLAARRRSSSWRKRAPKNRRYHGKWTKVKHGKRRGKRTVGVYRVNPGIPGGGVVSSGMALIKANAIGAAGAAVWDLYGAEPLLAKFGNKLPASQWTKSLAKILGGVAVGILANKFGPAMVKKHAGSFVAASMGIGFRDLVAVAASHPAAVTQGMGSLMYERMGSLASAPNYVLPEYRQDSFDHMGELEEDYAFQGD